MLASSAISDTRDFPPAVHPSLNHRLAERLPEFAERSHFRFIAEDGTVVVERTLGELTARAQRIGGQLLEREGLRPGDRVVLIYLPSLDFVEVLLGCLLCGVIPAAIMPREAARELAKPLVHRILLGFAQVDDAAEDMSRA